MKTVAIEDLFPDDGSIVDILKIDMRNAEIPILSSLARKGLVSRVRYARIRYRNRQERREISDILAPYFNVLYTLPNSGVIRAQSKFFE